ncbi:MAG: STAS domain-containing protein [Planctomycetaceae bacterium]|nr:STAS domain-containing protein [Planctomycetaceae bacterium]
MSDRDFDPGFFDLDCEQDLAVATFVADSLTDEDNIEQLGHELSAIVDKLQCRRVILDLNTVQYATSSVIGKWIMMHRKLEREQGKLVICGLQPGLEDILATSRLLNYFNVAGDAGQARSTLTAAAS